ncbi:MAG: hypothetical protein K6C12_08795 [Oscillospiraceae bacterium]|nr:hypothetical protein [Oscillospiraceae bacterium]
MKIIPEVKCRRCGESFSALRSRCPNCGTRRVSQSSRTPAPTPSTMKGTAAYERAETNTRWQLIFGLILVIAVILAVIVMVSTSLSGLDNQSGRGSKNNLTATPTPSAIVSAAPTPEAPPTPTPTPTPTVDNINIECFGTVVKDEFTMSMSRDPKITLQATVLPMEVFTTENTRITWKSSDESLFIVTPSADTRSCVVEMLQTGGPGTLTVTCNGFSVTLTVRLVN